MHGSQPHDAAKIKAHVLLTGRVWNGAAHEIWIMCSQVCILLALSAKRDVKRRVLPESFATDSVPRLASAPQIKTAWGNPDFHRASVFFSGNWLYVKIVLGRPLHFSC